jgi:hypothetical protein
MEIVLCLIQRWGGHESRLGNAKDEMVWKENSRGHQITGLLHEAGATMSGKEASSWLVCRHPQKSHEAVPPSAMVKKVWTLPLYRVTLCKSLPK